MRSCVLAFLLSTSCVAACECHSLTECELAAQPVVFIGKVVAGGVESVHEDPWYSNSRSVRFEVIQAFRGLATGSKFVEIEKSPTLGMCSPNPYRLGRTYLVTPRMREGRYFDGGCFTGRDAETFKDVVDYVRRHFQNPESRHIRGMVGAVHLTEPELVEHLLLQGEGKPLQGVTVSTTVGEKTYSATTDALGRYELAVPGSGVYSVQAKLAPYRSAGASILTGGGTPCKEHHFGMLSGSSISGNVFDSNGQRVPSAQVGLFDLDRPTSGRPARAWFRTAFPEQKDGTFLFENVPIGRYLLAFNPDGPQADGYKPYPLESTYHRSGTARGSATVIEVDRGGLRLTGKDVIVGGPVTFRSVTLRYRFADGAPMTSGVVDVVGEAPDPGGVQWYAWKFLMLGQTEVRFQVPANRRIRMSLRDTRGRDLGKAYESTHAPGASPILQEFVVEP